MPLRSSSSTTLSLVLVALGSVVAPPPSPLVAQPGVHEATIESLQVALEEGRVTAVELVDAHLARIAAYDQAGPRLNSILRLNPEARAQAEALDRERAASGPRGPLHGIPILLKDNYDFMGMPTTAGTLTLAGLMPSSHAFQVERLLEAGAVILGKTNMHELASGITTIGSLGGQTRNPYDPRRNPGGSSGGTGAAVAASFAVLGWGSDTCGSIRIPSAQNDLVGLRPSKGLSSIAGIIPLSHTQDVGGPLARTVRDLAIGLDATVGHDPRDPATDSTLGRPRPDFVEALDEGALQGARIGILETYFGDSAEDRAAGGRVREALDRMEELGATTVEVEFDDLGDIVAGTGLIQHEFKWDLMDYLASNGAPPVDSLGVIIAAGLLHEALVANMGRRNASTERESEAWRAAYEKRASVRGAVEEALDAQSLDALVFPTLRRPPALIGEPQRGSSCQLGAASGLPSISVPVGFTADGLPIGMEMMGRAFDDPRLVSLAYAFEQGTDHRRAPRRTPPLVDGRAPLPVVVEVDARGSGWEPPTSEPGRVQGRLVYDAVAQTLAFDLEVVGVPPAEVHAVVLRQWNEEGRAAVVARLLGPGWVAGQGTVSLDPELADALLGGSLTLELFTRAHPLGGARMDVELPVGN